MRRPLKSRIINALPSFLFRPPFYRGWKKIPFWKVWWRKLFPPKDIYLSLKCESTFPRYTMDKPAGDPVPIRWPAANHHDKQERKANVIDALEGRIKNGTTIGIGKEPATEPPTRVAPAPHPKDGINLLNVEANPFNAPPENAEAWHQTPEGQKLLDEVVLEQAVKVEATLVEPPKTRTVAIIGLPETSYARKVMGALEKGEDISGILASEVVAGAKDESERRLVMLDPMRKMFESGDLLGNEEKGTYHKYRS